MRRLTRLFFLILAVFPAGLVAGEEREAVDRLADLLDSLVSLEAPFHQTVVSRDGNQQQLKGRLSLRKPDRFRIHTEAPFEQTLISDGVKLWIVDPDLEQVIITRLDDDLQQIPILLLTGTTHEIASRFQVESRADESRTYFVLTPRDSRSLYSVMNLEFSGDVLSAISVEDSLGQKIRIQFEAVILNQIAGDERFSFIVPKGMDVIDDS